MKNNLFAIDVGTSKIACVAAAIDEEGRFSVLGTGLVPHDGVAKGRVVDVEAAGAAIENAVRAAERESGLEVTPLWVGLGGEQLVCRSHQAVRMIFPQGRPVRAEDMLQALGDSTQAVVAGGRELLQSLATSYRVDGEETMAPIGRQAGRLEVSSISLSVEPTDLDPVADAVQRSGFDVERWASAALASALAVSQPHEREQGCIVVDCGAGSTSVVVFRAGVPVWISAVSIGSRHLDADIRQLLHTGEKEAERLKVEAATVDLASVQEGETVDIVQEEQTQSRPLQRKVLCEIVESRLRETAELVKRPLERQGLLIERGDGLILTGRASRLKGAEWVFSSVFGLGARLGKPYLPEGGELDVAFAGALGLGQMAAASAQELTPASTLSQLKARFKAFRERRGGA